MPSVVLGKGLIGDNLPPLVGVEATTRLDCRFIATIVHDRGLMKRHSFASFDPVEDSLDLHLQGLGLTKIGAKLFG